MLSLKLHDSSFSDLSSGLGFHSSAKDSLLIMTKVYIGIFLVKITFCVCLIALLRVKLALQFNSELLPFTRMRSVVASLVNSIDLFNLSRGSLIAVFVFMPSF
jgi:hypothetical protein